MVSEVILIVVTYVAVFFLGVLLTKLWIGAAHRAGLVGKDMNKAEKNKVAESGGIAIVATFFLAVLGYLFMKTFVIESQTNFIPTFGLLLTVSLAAFIGFIDDILGWKIGLKQWQKPLLTLVIAIPLMVISVGNTQIELPFIGLVELGILYPLVIVPIGIVGASNGFNMVEGLNGLGTGLGIIILSALALAGYLSGTVWLSTLLLAMVASLAGFLVWNKNPAKVFPGDSMTYSVGALIAVAAILGNMQKLAIVLFLMYFLEAILKARRKFKAENFGKIKNGKLYRPYKKIYSITHIFMNGRSETSIVWILWTIQALISVGALVLFYWK